MPLGNASKNPHLPEVDVGEPFKGAVFFNEVQSSAKYSTVALALAVLFRLYMALSGYPSLNGNGSNEKESANHERCWSQLAVGV